MDSVNQEWWSVPYPVAFSALHTKRTVKCVQGQHTIIIDGHRAMPKNMEELRAGQWYVAK